MDIQEQLEKLEALENAYELECKNSYENSDETIRTFHRWYRDAVELFGEVLGENDSLFQKFRTADVTGNGYDLRDVYHSLSSDYALLKAKIKNYGKQSKSNSVTHEESNKRKKIFISHSKNDKPFAEALISLLRIMGFDETEIFCSSVPGYWIGNNKNFLQVIKTHFIDCNLFVIFIHSPRFYNSHISLNEMGAAWVLQNDYSSFLTSDMDYKQMDAVVTNHEIAVKVDSDDAKARMTDWKNRILVWAGKNNVDENIWEQERDRFLTKVNEITYVPIDKSDIKLTQEDEEKLINWVNTGDDAMNYSEYIGGGGDVMLGSLSYPINSSREKAAWRAFFMRLSKAGLVDVIVSQGVMPICQLTEEAYKYVDNI